MCANGVNDKFRRGIKYFRGVQIFQVKVDRGSTFLGVQIYRYRPACYTASWGAVLNGQNRTGSIWSVQEQGNHINYLELLATFLALQAFRVVEPWNNLPQEVACAASVDDFKKLIDQYSSNTMYKCM